MSTLTETLSKRRAEEIATACCVLADDRQSAVIVSRWEGECWVLPWAQLVSARLEGKKIELSFGAVRIVVTGENLHALVEAIADYRIKVLRELPPEYRQKAIDGEPLIAAIEIHRTGG